MSDDTKGRIIRTFLQLVAGGLLAGLTEQVVKDLPPGLGIYLVLLYTAGITFLQNVLEQEGVVKPFLKPDRE
jgi:hypothetical protein